MIMIIMERCFCGKGTNTIKKCVPIVTVVLFISFYFDLEDATVLKFTGFVPTLVSLGDVYTIWLELRSFARFFQYLKVRLFKHFFEFKLLSLCNKHEFIYLL